MDHYIATRFFSTNSLIEYYVYIMYRKKSYLYFLMRLRECEFKVFSSDLLSFNIHGKRSFLFMQYDLFCTGSPYIFISTINLKERSFSLNECVENLNDENVIFKHYILQIV